jgi:chromosome segregation ATPase
MKPSHQINDLIECHSVIAGYENDLHVAREENARLKNIIDQMKMERERTDMTTENTAQQNQHLLRDYQITSEEKYKLTSQNTGLTEKLIALREEFRHNRKQKDEITNHFDGFKASYQRNHGLAIKNELRQLKAQNIQRAKESAELRQGRKLLETQLGGLRAHKDELSASNERMRVELTEAFAANARLKFKLALSRATCKRLETLRRPDVRIQSRV